LNYLFFDLEAEVQNRITHQRKMEFCVLTTINFEGRKWLVLCSVTDRNFIQHCSFVEYLRFKCEGNIFFLILHYKILMCHLVQRVW